MNDEVKIYIDGMYFTWDDEKAIANLKKHKISFNTAATAFFSARKANGKEKKLYEQNLHR